MIDFSDCETTGSIFSGTEKKIGVRINDTEYMLKFQYVDYYGERYNHISEHIGSSAFNALGIEAQSTILGKFKGENVVACKIFGSKYEPFVPFNEVGESSLENGGIIQYSYDGIMKSLRDNRKLPGLERTIEHFWDMYIVDALLGNFDRHGGNWGFLKKNNKYRIAPVFDNGSCLYPRMNDESEMTRIIESEDLTNERIYKYPSSQIKLNGSRSTYYDVISSLQFENCNLALERIYKKLDMERIYDIVRDIDMISDIHKEFYIHMLRSRYEKIIKDSYKELG